MVKGMLTVKEVIEKLSTFPMESIVVVMDDGYIQSVEGVEFLKNDDGVQNFNIRDKKNKVLIW